ncbi:MAG: preprotein translocase subunit SecE [Actinomycetota bacterium]|nr:preprotein translocase subunit SecE [Actinomycetota bacterium]
MNQNREMRRHPTQAKRSGGGKPPAVRQTLTGGGGSPGRGGALRANWLRDIVSELRKVQWPTREEAWHLTWVVVLVSVSVGVVLGGLDSGFGWFMEHTVLPH